MLEGLHELVDGVHRTGRIFVNLFDVALGAWCGMDPHLCTYSKTCGKAVALEHDGQVYACDHYVYPDYALGNIMENSWEEMLASPVYLEFGAKKAVVNEKCESCSYFKYCAGDCQKHRYSKGSDPKELSHLCEGWEVFYPHAMPYFEQLADEVRKERAAAEAQMRAEQMRARAPVGKPGRNDPCPCGSGKKFKKCHGR